MGMKLRSIMLLSLALALTMTAVAHEDGFPEATLKSVFPDATGFTAREKKFTAEQVKRIEDASGSKVERNDNPLHFYVALGKPADGSGMLGIVVLVDARGPKGAIDMAIGIKRDGSIARVIITESADDKGLTAAAFLDQFNGKTADSPLALGKDIKFAGDAKAAEAVLAAVRRGLHMLAVAGSK